MMGISDYIQNFIDSSTSKDLRTSLNPNIRYPKASLESLMMQVELKSELNNNN